MSKDWLANNYNLILEWASNMTKSDELSSDLAHYAIEKFMLHDRFEEVMEREYEDPAHGHARAFILGIMRNSWFYKKSEFSRYYKAHRADIGHRKKTIEPEKFNELLESRDEDKYDYSRDFVIEAIEGIIEEMLIDNKKLWFSGKLFQIWLKNPNISEISRQTNIPRSSISSAIEEAKEHIRKELKNRNIDYDF